MKKGAMTETKRRLARLDGHSSQQNLTLVSFTGIDDRVRILSAHKATRLERKDYEENVGS